MFRYATGLWPPCGREWVERCLIDRHAGSGAALHVDVLLSQPAIVQHAQESSV